MSDAHTMDTIDDSAPTAPSPAPSGNNNGPLEYVRCNIDESLLNDNACTFHAVFNLFFNNFVEDDDNHGTTYMDADHQDSFDYVLLCAILSVN